MADLTVPTERGGAIDPITASKAWENSGTGAWIVDGTDLSDDISALDESNVGSFAINSTSGLTVTLEGGEAYVSGWLCRDRTTDIDVDDDTTTDIYAGFTVDTTLASGDAPADNENITIGTQSDFGSADPRVLIYTITSAGGSIDGTEDHRSLEKPVDYEPEVGRIDFSGYGRFDRSVVVEDIEGDFGNIYFYNNDELDGVQGHYLATNSPHLPIIIRNNSTNTLSLDDGDVDVPNGDLTVGGDATLQVTQDWDGDSMVLESSNGDTIELIRE